MVVLGQATGANHVSTDDLITSQSLFHCSRRTILALSAASKRIRYVNDFLAYSVCSRNQSSVFASVDIVRARKFVQATLRQLVHLVQY